MKTLRKLFIIVLVLSLFGLCACKSNKEEPEPKKDPEPVKKYGLDMSKDDVLTSVNTFISTVGISFNMKVGILYDEGYDPDIQLGEIGIKDNCIWVTATDEKGENGQGLASKLVVTDEYRDLLIYFYYEGKYQFYMATRLEETQNFFDEANLTDYLESFLACYDQADYMLYVGEETICSRKCNVYQLDTLKGLEGEEYNTALAEITSYTYFSVDQQTGLVMKTEIKYVEEGKDPFTTFEITNINFNPTAPDIQIPEKYIPVNVNELDMLNTLGLNGLLPSDLTLLDDETYKSSEFAMIMMYNYYYNITVLEEQYFDTALTTYGQNVVAYLQTVADDGKVYETQIVEEEYTQVEVETCPTIEDHMFVLYFTKDGNKLTVSYSLDTSLGYDGGILTISVFPQLEFTE